MADAPAWNETLVDRRITYHVEIDGHLFVIENVPARVNVETGANHFSSETVERLHTIIREQPSPVPSKLRCTNSYDQAMGRNPDG